MQYLIEILDKEANAYNDYLALAVRKKEALLANDVDSLEAITLEEKGITAKVLALEAARTEYLREEGFQSGITMQELVKSLKEPDKDSISNSAGNLKDILERCRKFNTDNMALLRQSSNYINHMIKVFSQNISDDNPTYKQGSIKLGSGKIADMQG